MRARPRSTIAAPSFNGRTADSGSAYRGSNPWGAAKSYQPLTLLNPHTPASAAALRKPTMSAIASQPRVELTFRHAGKHQPEEEALARRIQAHRSRLAAASVRPGKGLLGQRRAHHHCLRRLGRVGQGHDHLGADPAAGSARLQALSHHRSAHLRAAASVAVALLAEGAQPRRDGHLRSQLVRPRAARSGSREPLPRRRGSRHSATSSSSSACWPTTAP